MMKNILLAIMLSVLSLGAVHAQTAELQTNSEPQAQTTQKSGEDEDSLTINGVRFELNSDDDERSTDQKLEDVKEAIKESFGEEFAKEIKLEIDGMSDEEKEKIASILQEDGLRIGMDKDDIPFGAVLIAVPAVILTLGMPVIIVLLVLWFGHKKRRQKMEIINTYLQADKEVPEQVLNAFDSEAGAGSLRRGILLTGVGLGVVAAFNGFGESEIGALGLIPMFMGIARLIYWFVEERKA